MPEIQAFVFDMDGVITDTAELHFRSWKQLADEEGIPFTRKDNDNLRGVTRRESLRRMLKGRPITEEQAEDWMARKNAYFHALLDQITPESRLPGITDLVEGARAHNLKLAVASASRNVRPVLTRLNLLDAFDIIADAYTVEKMKPAPDIFLWVADQLDVKPAQGVVFEDSESGVTAATSAGFWTIGIGPAEVGHAHVCVDDLGGFTVQSVIDLIQSLDRSPVD